MAKWWKNWSAPCNFCHRFPSLGGGSPLTTTPLSPSLEGWGVCDLGECGGGEAVVWSRSSLGSPSRRCPAVPGGQGASGLLPGGRGRTVRGPSAPSAQGQDSGGACVLVSEQFHVEHLRVRVCCVLDLRGGNRSLVFKPSGPVAMNLLSWLSLQTLPKSDT